MIPEMPEFFFLSLFSWFSSGKSTFESAYHVVVFFRVGGQEITKLEHLSLAGAFELNRRYWVCRCYN